MADRRLKKSRARSVTKAEVDRPALKPRIRYEIILYWSKPDGAYIAEVPELPGCAADGKTYGEALANAEVIIKEWIETAKELGRPVPKPAAGSGCIPVSARHRPDFREKARVPASHRKKTDS